MLKFPKNFIENGARIVALVDIKAIRSEAIGPQLFVEVLVSGVWVSFKVEKGDYKKAVEHWQKSFKTPDWMRGFNPFSEDPGHETIPGI